MGAQRGARPAQAAAVKCPCVLGPGQVEDPGNRKIQGCHPAPTPPGPVASTWREGKGKELVDPDLRLRFGPLDSN